VEQLVGSGPTVYAGFQDLIDIGLVGHSPIVLGRYFTPKGDSWEPPVLRMGNKRLLPACRRPLSTTNCSLRLSDSYRAQMIYTAWHSSKPADASLVTELSKSIK